MIGQTLGHYRLVEKIGEGGMGVVYRAHDERLDRDVALKVLPPGTLADEAARKRFRKEALALSKLNHPHIETVHDFDTQDGVDFLVMEHIPGVTLSDKLAAGPLPEKEVVRLGVQLADGLAAAHEQGVVHRDLKPGNLRLTPDGRVKILDFGLAKLLRPESQAAATSESLTETRATAGTLPYMAPEQLRGQPADARSDLWALGVVLYEAATGERPFQGQTAYELSSAILREPPAAMPARVSTGLRTVIERCLEKDPSHRYQRASEVRAALEAIQSGVAVVPRVRWERWLSRRRWLALAGALVGLGVVLVALNVGGVRERLLPATAAPRIRSLAVLPLENLSRDPEQEYFADGMTEALITELSKIRALKVISRTSAMRYKNTDKPMPQIARELGVEGVVEGSVLREGDQVRITVQLIHGGTDKHLWADSYQRELRGVLALQSEVARSIAQAIQIKVTPQEQVRLARTRPVNPAAHEAYLRGRYYWNQRTEGGLKKSLEYFHQAIEADPSYALAYAGMADSYNILANRGYLAPQQGWPKAKAAAQKALAIDSSLGEAHAALAFGTFYYDWDWRQAESEFNRAVELNPSYAASHHWFSHYLVGMGRFSESLIASQRALELDPLDLSINVHLAWHYYAVRQYDRAIEQVRRALEMSPFSLAHIQQGLNYEQIGRYEEAIAEFQTGLELAGESTEALAHLGHAYAVAGRHGDAQKVLSQLKALSRQRYVSPFDIGIVYAGLGEKDEAFAWLEKAYEQRSSGFSGLVYLNVDPRLDPLRSDPRFQELQRRMELPP